MTLAGGVGPAGDVGPQDTPASQGTRGSQESPALGDTTGPPAPDVLGRSAAVVGAGAVGTLLAGCLAAGGWRVTLVDRAAGAAGGGPGAAADGVALVGPGSRVEHRLPVQRVASVAGLSPDIEVILIATKQFALPAVLDGVPVGPTLVTVQNGIGAEEAARERVPNNALVAASLTAAVEPRPPDGVRWLRRGGIGLAPVTSDVADVVDGLARAFADAGLPARPITEWRAMKWSKLIANLVGNATSAILDLDPGAVYRDAAGFAVERAQLREAVAVMRALGLRPMSLPGAPVPWLVAAIALPSVLGRPALARIVGGARGGKPPSLRVDAGRGGGGTEVRWLNGAVAAAGERAGVPARVNAGLAGLVEDVGSNLERAAWFRGRPDRLADALGVRAHRR